MNGCYTIISIFIYVENMTLSCEGGKFIIYQFFFQLGRQIELTQDVGPPLAINGEGSPKFHRMLLNILYQMDIKRISHYHSVYLVQCSDDNIKTVKGSKECPIRVSVLP